MALPTTNITFQNGQLGQLVDTPDGVFGLLASAVAVAATFALNTPYQVRGMADVAALGITPSVDNYVLYKALKEYYAEAGDGTELWFMGLARTTKVSDWFTIDGTGKTPAEKLLDTANGKLTMLYTAYSPLGSYVVTLENGIDADVWVAAAKAQTLAENYTTNKYAPFYTIIEGYAYDGIKTAVKDLLTLDYNRVQIMLGDTEPRTGVPASKGAAVGVLAGRKAKIAVQVNPGRARDGVLSNTKAYILDTPAELYDVTALHDKGYVTFRTRTGKSGYYFTDDPLACAADDDYHYGTNRRVIDKAYRLAYGVLSEFELDDTSVLPNGTIDPIYAKSVEAAVISAIYNGMTTEGNLSYDASNPSDKGVICVVDLTHNVMSTSRLKLSKLQVASKATLRYIDVPLGFVPITTT